MNITSIHNEDPSVWAERHFGELDLGDVRRNQRAVTIAAAMANNPDKSIPQVFRTVYDVKAAYNFFRHPDVTPENLQQFHREQVQAEIERAGHYLLLEDTTEIHCTEGQEIEGLGPIGSDKKRKRGFHLHSILAVRWSYEKTSFERWPNRPSVEVLGLPVQHYNIRVARPESEAKNHPEYRMKRERESQWWQRAGESVGPAPLDESVIWTRVCDRGADIYELLVSCQQLTHNYVIRACQDRSVIMESGETDRLFAIARSQAAIGEYTVDLRTRPKTDDRIPKVRRQERTNQINKPSRTAKLSISVTDLVLPFSQSPWTQTWLLTSNTLHCCARMGKKSSRRRRAFRMDITYQ